MFAWVVIPDDHIDVLASAVARAWTGAAAVARLELPNKRANKPPKRIAVIALDKAKGKRGPRWPDVLLEWSEINEEPLFPGGELPVLAEELSALGAQTLCVHAGPGFTPASVAWYEKGALVGFEHVGGTPVIWDPDGGLGRTLEGATGETLIAHALENVLGQPPPLLQLLTDDPARAAGSGRLRRGLGATRRVPAHDHRRRSRHVPGHGVLKVAGPAAAPVLPVREHVDADLPLHLEHFENLAVLDLAQTFQRQIALSVTGIRIFQFLCA